MSGQEDVGARVVLVTGGNRGIGLTTASRLLKAGHRSRCHV